LHVDGRSNCDDPPSEPVVHLTKGDSRDHRPDLNQVMLALIVEHQAGIPVLMKPRSGHSSDATDFGQTVSKPIKPLQTTYGTTSLVADSALYREDHLGKRRDTPAKWITPVPATLSDVQLALSPVEPDTMSPLKTGYRYKTLRSTYGHVPQRGLLISSALRRLQAQRTGHKRWLKHREKEAHAFQKRCRTDFACEADALQAVTTCEPGWPTTAWQPVSIRRVPR
jgi:transposase